MSDLNNTQLQPACDDGAYFDFFPFTDADRQAWERLETEAEGDDEENVYFMMREEVMQ